MQFAGQRTDMDLKPIGEPVNILIKMTPDVLPDPDAVLITGITPQQTLTDGLTEAEFLKIFNEEICTPDTIMVGFNSIRFDDEFMRFLLYRNFYDPYEWQWKDGCSRWDILDLVRMTRALRPDGIEWPFAADGKPANRLEYLTKVNKLDHYKAHDALSDVHATIAVAKLIKAKQPQLFQHLLGIRGKKEVAKVVDAGNPFVYTSGRYGSQFLHTTVVAKIHKPTNDSALVYDLRFDPTPFINMSVDELIQAWKFSKEPDHVRLPVKTLKYNRCPAVAPLGVMKDKAAQERLQLPLETITKHLEILKEHHAAFTKKLIQALEKMDAARAKEQVGLVDNQLTVDERLYDGFMNKADVPTMRAVRAAKPDELGPDLANNFQDERLKSLLPLYKARNFPKVLTSEERTDWDAYCHKKLLSGGEKSRMAQYFSRLQALSVDNLSGEKQYLLEELQLYAESVMPSDID